MGAPFNMTAGIPGYKYWMQLCQTTFGGQGWEQMYTLPDTVMHFCEENGRTVYIQEEGEENTGYVCDGY